MRTYPADILRQALWKIIDNEKYHRISIYSKSDRPLKYKGRICGIWCDLKGMRINFHKGFLGRRKFRMEISIPVRDIRWAENPINWEKFEDMCRELTPKLSGPEQGGRMISPPASATLDQPSIRTGPDILEMDIEVEGMTQPIPDIIEMDLQVAEERTLKMFKQRWWHRFTRKVLR